MSKEIWHDCEKQPPLVDDGELVLMDSNDKFWVGFCRITSDGVSYFANNAEPLKNDFVKYARIDKLLALEAELQRTRKALDVAVDGIKYMRNNCLEYAADYMDKADEILEQITALEKSDLENLEILVNNVFK